MQSSMLATPPTRNLLDSLPSHTILAQFMLYDSLRTAAMLPLGRMTELCVSINLIQLLPRHLPSVCGDMRLKVYLLLSKSTGTNETAAVENWRIFRRLVAHDNDIQDLGWSYDSSILVSVGLDSKIIVWSGHTFEKLKTISSHQSHVKGICFDPANKYFATASDDRTLKIWNFTSPAPTSSAHDHLNNFNLERTIHAPFTSSPLTTYFRRCSWSPDGLHIGAANAINGPSPSVAIINRGSWDSDINLIGHDAPTQVCAFSPRLYSKDPNPIQNGANSHNSHLVTVIACGGMDMTLTVWITSNPRPLVITQQFTATAITDLAWSPDGKCLFITSMDGSVGAVIFEDGELGYPMDFGENEKTLTKFGTNRKGAGMIESADGFLLEERSKAGEMRGAQGRMGELMGDVQDVRPNGVSNAGPSALVPVNTTAATMNGPANGVAPAQDSAEVNTAKVQKMKSMVYRDKDGKKRVRPMQVNQAGAESSLPQPQLVATGQTTKADAPRPVLDLSKPFDGLPKGGLAALLLGNKRKLAVIEGDEDGRVEKRIALASQNGATPIVENTPDGLLPARPSGPVQGQQQTQDFIRPAVVNPSLLISTTRLAVPRIRNQIVQAIDSDGLPSDPPTQNDPSAPRGDWVFEIRNPPPASLTGRAQDREPVKVSLTRRAQMLWQDFLPRPVLLTTGNQHFWSAACEDGSVYVWTPAGRRLVNAMVLEAQPVILENNGPWILCITAVGMCYVWNTKSMSSPHPPVSLAPILDAALHSLTAHPSNAPAITAARVNSEGRIVVALTNGEGYSYSPSMFTWQRLSEAWWAVGSQYWNSTDSSVGNLQSSGNQSDSENTANVSAGIIPFLERNTTSETLLRGRSYYLQRLIKALLYRDGYDFFESGVSIAHLENRLAAALMLGAKDEFRLHLLMYAKRLGSENAKYKVEELLSMLLGEEEEDTLEGGRAQVLASRNWQGGTDTLCGWSRRELLKAVVLLLGKSSHSMSLFLC
jgi:protein HIRA/HIR1